MKVSNVSFNGNYLIKFPSKKARDVSDLFINFDNGTDEFICQKVGENKLHVLTGKEAEDWSDMTEVCHKCNFTRWPQGLFDVNDKHFLETAVPIDFSKVTPEEDFMNGCLIQFAQKKPEYEWLPRRVAELLPDELKDKVLKKK